MREIKFKFYDKKTNKLVEECDMWWNYIERFDRDEVNVCEFTGLHDKNGKEIYEGDIVKTFWQHDGVECHDYELIGEIVWNKEDACFSLDCSDQIIRFITTYEREELLEIEVIGNIYENPELLTHEPI